MVTIGLSFTEQGLTRYRILPVFLYYLVKTDKGFF